MRGLFGILMLQYTLSEAGYLEVAQLAGGLNEIYIPCVLYLSFPCYVQDFLACDR